MTRTHAQSLIVALLFTACFTSCTNAAPPPPPLDPAAQLRVLEQHIDDAIQNDKLARENGYVYAVDIAQLMTDAAIANNSPRYIKLRRLAINHLLIDDESDPYTRNFVAWRYDPTGIQTPDASGTTEALRLAEALWYGEPVSSDFNVTDQLRDRELAINVIHAYARHIATDQGVWRLK